MTKREKEQYQDIEILRELVVALNGQKFVLDCGHRVTFGTYLGNDITIFNGHLPVIVCTLCAR